MQHPGHTDSLKQRLTRSHIRNTRGLGSLHPDTVEKVSEDTYEDHRHVINRQCENMLLTTIKHRFSQINIISLTYHKEFLTGNETLNVILIPLHDPHK